MNIGGAKPIGKGLIIISFVQKTPEIISNLSVELFLGFLNCFGFVYFFNGRNLSGSADNILRKPIEFSSSPGKGIGLSSNPGIPRRAGRPYLVGVPYMITTVL